MYVPFLNGTYIPLKSGPKNHGKRDFALKLLRILISENDQSNATYNKVNQTVNRTYSDKTTRFSIILCPIGRYNRATSFI